MGCTELSEEEDNESSIPRSSYHLLEVQGRTLQLQAGEEARDGVSSRSQLNTMTMGMHKEMIVECLLDCQGCI
jgi:hypothetical protein